MKVRTVLLGVISVAGNDVAAFQTATRIHTKIDAVTGTTTALTAQQQAQSSRKDFLSSMLVVGIAVGTSTIMPLPAQAMDQYNDKTPTEFWTTGKPTTDKGKPNERTIKARSRDAENLWPNARTQNNVRRILCIGTSLWYYQSTVVLTAVYLIRIFDFLFCIPGLFVSRSSTITYIHTYIHMHTVELCTH